MILIDTSVLYAFYDTNDSCYERAKQELSKLHPDKILIPSDVMKELITLLSLRKGGKIAKMIYMELESKDVTIYNLETLEFLEFMHFFLEKPDNNLSMADLQLLFLSQKHGFRIITFDKKLLQTQKDWL